jgi:p-hydroxybenzoate 3-monooxygenase
MQLRTQVGIVGAGPAGLFLSLLLHRAGIDCVVLESRSRNHIETRVRAGVLEQHTVSLMEELGVADRLRREGMTERALDFRFAGRVIHLDFAELTSGRTATVYGQQEVVKDLVAARIASGAPILFEAEALEIEGIDGPRPVIRYRHEGAEHTLSCDIVAGCDGFHGISRQTIPESVLTVYDRIYPFSWIGILSESPPLKEMTYANHRHGFALASRRSPQLARLYIQIDPGEDFDAWPDDRIWDELHTRLGDGDRSEVKEGRIVQRGVNNLRAFVCEPMRHGRLYLAGDAAHIVPPAGAKGLNLAVADVRVLAGGLVDFFRTGATERLDRYTQICLTRVWKIVRFSNYLTSLLHRFDSHTPFERQVQLSELDYLATSRAAQTTVAENYAGLPLAQD